MKPECQHRGKIPQSQAVTAKTRMMGLEGASEVYLVQTVSCFPDEEETARREVSHTRSPRCGAPGQTPAS